MTSKTIPPEDERLLPCPFCGAAADGFKWKGHVGCTDRECGAYAANLPIAQWNRRSTQPDGETAWAECFDAQKSIICFLRETLEQIKRDNQHYNFGSKLVRIVDEALAKVPKVSPQPDREAIIEAPTPDIEVMRDYIDRLTRFFIDRPEWVELAEEARGYIGSLKHSDTTPDEDVTRK